MATIKALNGNVFDIDDSLVEEFTAQGHSLVGSKPGAEAGDKPKTKK